MTVRVSPDPARGTRAKLRKADEIPRDARDVVTRTADWQRSAYDLSTLVGQVGKVHHMRANTVSACDIRPVYTDPETGNEWTMSELLSGLGEDEKDTPQRQALRDQALAVKRVHDAFVAPLGGRKELLRKASLNLSIGGESFLVGSPTEIDVPNDDSPGLVWEFLSPLEIDPDKYGTITRKRAGHQGITMSGREELGKGEYIARIWNSATDYSELPESGMQRALPDCRSYLKLRAIIDASADSRIPAGVVKVPEGLDAVGMPQDSDDPNEEGARPFTEAFVEHLSSAFEDPGSASRLLPIFAVGDPDLLKGLEKMELGDEQNAEWASALRQEVLTYISQDLDISPDMMTGKGELNHWSGYSSDAEYNSKWVIPQGEFISSFSTVAYLHAMLELFEQWDAGKYQNWRYVFDASTITARADKGVTATRLGDRGQLAEEAVVLANGFTLADMPNDEERRIKVLKDLIAANAALAPQLLPLIPGFEDIVLVDDSRPGGIPPAPPAADEPTGRSGGDPESGGREPLPPVQSVPGTPNADASIIDKIVVASDAAIDRALEKAGSRAVSRINLNKIDSSKLPAADRLRLDKSKALSSLGPADFSALGVTPEQLLDGAWDDLAMKVRGWVQPWVVARCGFNGAASVDVARNISEELCARLQTITLADRGTRLYDDGMKIPPSVVVAALETAAPVKF